MKSDFQNSPVDRLIDELLREQSNGPDEALLQQIESAVDAGAPVAVKRPTRRHYGRLAIAAGIALVAAASIFFHLESRDSRNSIAMRQASDAEVAGKVKAASRSQELDQAIRDQEAKVEEKRMVLATIEARPADGESTAVTPSLIGKLKYVKDESLTWVLRPTYGDGGKFPFNYLDNKGGVNKTGAADMIGPNDLFFTKGVMMNRFKFLGSKVRRELSPKTNSQVEITYVRIEDQRPNKKGTVYEFPAPLSEERFNEHQKFDRTAIFSLEALGLNGKEFEVEENTAFSLPPGGEKKDYLLKSITPAGVVVEMVDGGQMVEISKGSMPAGEALAANPTNSQEGDISADAIKRGLDAQDYVDVKRELSGSKGVDESSGDGDEPEKAVGPNVRVIRHQDGSRSIFTREPDRRIIVKKSFSPQGALTLKVTYKMDEGGKPLGCKIVDGQNQELFTVLYGYSKTSGLLVAELMFDSRVKRVDPESGKELPLQKVRYIYDSKGKRSQPIVSNFMPGHAFEEVFGEKSSLLEPNPFDDAGAAPSARQAEVIPAVPER
jgi:hypothetical protein